MTVNDDSQACHLVDLLERNGMIPDDKHRVRPQFFLESWGAVGRQDFERFRLPTQAGRPDSNCDVFHHASHLLP